MHEGTQSTGRAKVETVLLGAIVVLIALVAAVVLLVTRPGTERRERGPQVNIPADSVAADPAPSVPVERAARSESRPPKPPATSDAPTEIPPESARGGTLLRVHVTDPSGALVDGGHVVCRSWGPPGLTTPFDADVMTNEVARLEGRVVEFRLPWTKFGVWVDALPDGYVPARREIPDLRHREQPRRMRGEEIVIDVQIDAMTSAPSDQLHGAVLVDGVQRTPERLSIVLLPRLNDRVQGDRVAVVHPEDGTFVVDSLGEPWKRFLVKSDETVPMAHEIDAGHDPSRPIFVSLDTGATLHLTVTDGAGERYVGLPVWYGLRVLVRHGVADDGDPYTVRQTIRKESVTDANGEARLLGLLPGNDAVIYAEDAEGLRRRLLDLAADEVHGNVYRTVVLDDLVRTRIFGPMPKPGEFPGTIADEPLAIRLQEFVGEKKVHQSDRELDPVEETWEIRTTVPRRCRFWLVQREQVMSEVVEVTATGPEPMGPITFVPAAKTGRVVRWVNAPPDVALEIRAITDSGQATLVAHEAAPPLGDVSFDLAADEVEIRIELALREGGQVERRAMMGPGDLEFMFDLAGDVSSRIEPRIEDEPAEDGCRVGLLALGVDPAFFAMFTIHDGRTPRASIPPGDYLAILERPGLVCGIVRFPRGRDQLVKWDWQGELVPLSSIFEGAPTALVLDSVDGVDLAPLIEPKWRRINEELWGVSAADLESGEDPLVHYSKSYRLAPYQRNR